MRSVGLLGALSVAASLLVAVGGGASPAGAASPISSHVTFNCHLRSRANHLYVSAELSYAGALRGVLRARSASVGAWEKDQCVAAGSNQWAIKSLANHLYTSTELGFGGGTHDVLRARSSAAGAWEKYTLVSVASCACYALRSSANGLYASTELGYAGSLRGLVRARSSKIGAWEQFDVIVDTPPPAKLAGVTSIATAATSACAVLASGGVDCWGDNSLGQLGSGTGTGSSAKAVPVHGVGNVGTLTGVASVISTGDYATGYCAVLQSGGVDCWGNNGGSLGIGTSSGPQKCDGGLYDCATSPVAVHAVGGVGTLGGVAGLTAGPLGSVCARLSSGGVDCWDGSHLTPIAVPDVGGSGTLSGVASVVQSSNPSGFCAVLTSGDVDCWNRISYGPLPSYVPVVIRGVGGVGTLTGVAAVVSGTTNSTCALLASGGVDCWGDNYYSELGDGTNTNRGDPVAVHGVGNVGTLSGVTSMISDGGSYCAVVNGGVDCWGRGLYGELGIGTLNATPENAPVAVHGVGNVGTLSSATELATIGTYDTSQSGGYCAVTTGGVACWGSTATNTPAGNGVSGAPVAIAGVGGTGTLTNVTALVGVRDHGYCAIIAGNVACWGNFISSTAHPVYILT